MLQVKSFEYWPGYGATDLNGVDLKVNKFILSLREQGITNVEVKVTASDKVFVYTIIYDDAPTNRRK